MGFFDAISNLIKNSPVLSGNDEKNALYLELTEKMGTASREMKEILSTASGYLYEHQYADKAAAWKEIEKQADQELRYFRFLMGSAYRSLESRYAEYRTDQKVFLQGIERHNAEVLQRKIIEGYRLIGDVEGKKLDRQQMTCIVKDAHSHLVIAGAGTGKTTTILGKIKYLLATEQYTPQELLVLSFTNASASEMKERLLKETGQDIYVATFHKLGYDIIRRADQIAPNVFREDLRSFVRREIEICCQNEQYQTLLKTYLLFHRVPEKSEFGFTSQAEYLEYLDVNPPTTIRGETVKSYGEMKIANFLMQYGIRYEYEPAYPVDTRTEEYGQYHPDFFLPDYRVYIEYFGVDRQGNVPSYFAGKDGKSASQVYRESALWKRDLHQKNNTTLVECYAFENLEGTLTQALRGRLEQCGVTFNELPFTDLLAATEQGRKSVFSTLADTMATVITLARNQKLTPEGLTERVLREMSGQKILSDLIRPVFENYVKRLEDSGEVDFTDMLNRAEELTTSNAFVHKFRMVIVDEYQDVSASQYRLLKTMRNQADYELFCVGDDWQSIYRFAGSDIGYILNFRQYWGEAELSRIETTYRFSQRLIDISSSFVMENPNQIKKYIKSGNGERGYVLGRINGYGENAVVSFMVSKLDDLPKDSTVFFLGRYQFDIELLRKSNLLRLNYDNTTSVQRVIYTKRPDLTMSFYTAHGSKGLQADYVFILNNRKGHLGFPSKVQNSPIVELLLEKADTYPDAEERRLFYVTLTRARKRVYLVTCENNVSSFASELIDRYEDEIRQEAWSCPRCDAALKKISGPYGEFFGCSNYKITGCTYKRVIHGK
ncbi:MAG: UvrD-helicase domain-containing protein [Lachnospiraceae bacterium]|nr:UvrD-helicase domain-containing protein [Lachnospiraceae bacterium]